jgi:hypothetical protein
VTVLILQPPVLGDCSMYTIIIYCETSTHIYTSSVMLHDLSQRIASL